MLILVQRRWQFKVVLLHLGVDRLWRQQRDLAVFQQLEDGLDLERGRAAGEFAFLAALLDRDVSDALSRTNVSI